MSIEIVRSNGVPSALIHMETGKTETIALSPIEVLGPDLTRLLGPLVADLTLKRDQTARLALLQLKQLGEAFQHLGYRGFPTSDDGWQQLVLDVHQFIHTRADREQSLVTRHLVVWAHAQRCFRLLADEAILPVSVHIPPVLESLLLDQQSEQLLGESEAAVVAERAEADKLLLPISLARSDAEYLDEIHKGLLDRRQTLFACLTDYWERMRSNLEFGKKLRSSLSEGEVERLIYEHAKGFARPVLPGRSIADLASYLIVLERLYDGSAFRYRGATAEKRTIPNLCRYPAVEDWPIARELPPNFSHLRRYTNNYLVWWWLGRISHLDVAFIVALLTMLHPRWTPSSLVSAALTNRDGKSYLDLGEEGVGFEVEKPRAKAMKHEVLCPLSEEILTTLIDFSADIRAKLPSDNPLRRKLFLPYGRVAAPGAMSVSTPIHSLVTALISGRNSSKGATWLGSLYPQLEEVGLVPGTMSLKRIRATEGVLEWFRTKSARAAAKKIGNSERIVLEHYIPRALVRAWMTRAIRRFQNLWITVAAADEPFLLDVTDFSSLQELNAFVSDMLRLHAPSSSPLAAELHLRLKPADLQSIPVERSGNLHVSLSRASLSALYCYRATASQAAVSRQALARVDPSTGVASDAFIQLADLLQVRLPLDRNSDYRRIHAEALEGASDTSRIARWAKLIFEGAGGGHAAV